jgi:prevent-host-death family protein
MAPRLPLTEARTKLADIVSDAQYGGKVTIITRHGKDAAAVVPLTLFRADAPEPKKAPMPVNPSPLRGKAKA